MATIFHQYAYLASLIFFILPLSIFFDSMTSFKVGRALITAKGLAFIVLSVVFWSMYDVFWINHLGNFPSNRVLFSVYGVPFEEMLLFALGLYNIGAILAWAKQNFS